MVIILLPLKENTPYLPNVPLFLPLYVLPRDSAASSIIGTLYLLQIEVSSSIFALCPYRLTIIIALGRLPLFFASLSARSNAIGDIFQVSISESIKTGVAP